jgi:hypothetical protein
MPILREYIRVFRTLELEKKISYGISNHKRRWNCSGSYDGRVIHIHVKVHTFDGSNETLEGTSQFYLNNYINERIHTQPPYSKHGPIDMTNEEDFIYKGPSSDGLVKANTGQHLMLKLNGNEQQGYTGTII